MAATAYAAAVSLLNTMDQIQIHPLLSTYFNKYSIESLRENVDFFVDFVEKYADAESEEAEDLLRQIADVAHEAEEIINVEAAHRIRKLKKITQYAEDLVRRMVPSFILSAPAVLLGLRRITEEMNFIKEKVTKLKEGTGFIVQSSMLAPPSSSSPSATSKTTMVGFDGYLEQLLDQLTGHLSGRQILPIVGMGGIGKTTLATNVYQHSLVLHHFHIRAWITVSQEFTARTIILQALSCLGGSTSKTDTSESDDELGEKLSKILYGRRYLIVLDDIWSVEAWKRIMFFFPENNNRSRIIVTTRESELVDYFSSYALAVDFLDEKNSWELFCEKTFAKEGCPPDLEEIGKEIVDKCKGLPLAITVVGALLRKSPSTREYWEMIAKDKSKILESGEGNITPLSVLYLSYKHLPIWLKPCFLYLGLFPEDLEIEVSELIKLWVAEGFIRSKTEQRLEEIAESYTKELVDRNLLLIVGLTHNKKLKSCRVHDVVRELCIRIGEREKFFCVQRDLDGMHHFIVDEATARLFYPRECQGMLPSLFCPLLLEGRQPAVPFKSRLLRVFFRGMSRKDFDSSKQILYSSQHVNLRFLFNNNGCFEYMLHSSIQILWSLQTLIVHSSIAYSFNAPCEIWKMPQLRHIEMVSISIPDPPSLTCEDDAIVLHNLQTLKSVINFKLSEEVCKRIPNIKELSICYKFNVAGEASSCNLHNLGCFNKLESLQLYNSFNRWGYLGGDSLQNLKFPSSLKELSLEGYVWSDMEMIASLPHLQLLNLGNGTTMGPKWDCVEGEFICLKHLFIYECDVLINWNADSSSFPVLEKLTLWGLSKLEEIPSGMGDILTLERMEVQYCSESVIMSAIKILEEQESLGNLSLQLTLSFWDEDKAVMWRGRIQQLGITFQNFIIKCR